MENSKSLLLAKKATVSEQEARVAMFWADPSVATRLAEWVRFDSALRWASLSNCERIEHVEGASLRLLR